MRSRPLHIAVAALLAAVLLVLGRLAFVADGDVGRFVVAGEASTTPGVAVPVERGPGYDGQFSYRLAVDPTDLGPQAHGVVLDGPLRLQRIAYPALAHVAALGQQRWVPAALVAVNVVAVGLLGLLGAVVARGAGRSPWTGLLLPAFSGFVMTLSRDLTELVTVVLLVAGVWAWQRGARVLASVALSAAVLSRETVLVLAGALVLTELVRSRRWQDALVGVGPVLAFVTWQAVCWAGYGEVPLLDSGGRNLVLPGTDLLPAAVGWVQGAASLDRQSLVDVVQAGVLATTVLLAARRSEAPPAVRAAWLAAVLLVVSLSESVWRGPADFRTAAELHALSVVLLLQSRQRLAVPAALAAVAVLGTGLLRTTSL